MAGAASAACTNSTPFAAWSSWNGSANVGAAFGGVTVATDGLDGTSCAMASSFSATGKLGQQAIVYDNSPQKEQTYRFRFYIDPTAVAANLSSLNTVAVFGAQSASNHGTAGPTNQLAQIYLIGSGGNVFLRTWAACSTGDNQISNRCRAASDLQLPSPFQPNGVRVEGQVIVGSAGTGKVNLWVGSNVNAAAPDATINVDNSAWGSVGTDGVKQARLGLFQSSSSFQTAAQNKVVVFDEFDSRRQTFIGQ